MIRYIRGRQTTDFFFKQIGQLLLRNLQVKAS